MRSGGAIESVNELEEALSAPTPALVEDLAALDGDVLVLGVGGKMGPSLARLARRAFDAAGLNRSVIGVDRFPSPEVAAELNEHGIETITCDLIDPDAVEKLPDAPNIVYMAGRKFGSSDNQALTWAMNTYMPALVARRYRRASIVVFSSGNVYPFVSVADGGAKETDPVDPVGEYAQSVLGRERTFEYFSGLSGAKVTILRLNYAVELRYGVLVDIAQRVHGRIPVDVRMGHANVIWQRDANEVALRALSRCASPPTILNLTGPETISVRNVAERFGERFGVEPIFEGQEAPTALLNDASRCHEWFGPPTVSLDQVIAGIAHWISLGGATLGKPTHFEQRDGKF